MAGYQAPPDPYGQGMVVQQTVQTQPVYDPYAGQPQTVVIQQPVYAQPAPQQVVVVQSDPVIWTDNANTAWILFVIGFCFPICWCIGAAFVRSRDPSARIAGIMNIIFSCLFVIAIIIVIVVVTRFSSFYYY